MLLRLFRTPALSNQMLKRKIGDALAQLSLPVERIATEWCYYVSPDSELDQWEFDTLAWLLKETFAPHSFSNQSFLSEFPTILEVGPRLNFETAFSTTAVAICRDCGLGRVNRLERSVRYGFPSELAPETKDIILSTLYDRMTEQPYEIPLEGFKHRLELTPSRIIPLSAKGIELLQQVNDDLGLAMDKQDLGWCYELFVCVLKRDPTDVELFQIAQANSEHCRHGFFRAKLVIDGLETQKSLMDIVKEPWKRNPNNSVIAFHDDSSAIRGVSPVESLIQMVSGFPSPFIKRRGMLHPALTAETHNFPSGVAPYPGAQTGTGGRIRDNISVGRGGQMMAGGAGYCTGNLLIPGYDLPWEKNSLAHPPELASPLEIMIEASNGASDYGNCIGEPVIYGFCRTFGAGLPDGYRSWFKPIMYSDGIGQLDDLHTVKGQPEKGMLIIKIGGPAYRIGMGGGAASSMMQGDNKADLDFNAVQRGAPEMEQRVWRVIRSCLELGENNPIVSIHDLGAGGDCNALPELLLPAGGRIELRSLPIGDDSLSVLEIWGNESQEREAFLIRPDNLEVIEELCERESVPLTVAGEVVGDSMIILHDETNDINLVELPLGEILENLPRKTFGLMRQEPKLKPLELPDHLGVSDALDLVLRLPSVGSKAFLTRKVDRSVTGLIIQQQCVGPNHIPLADYAAVAQGYWDQNGIASSIGEQPLKGLISPKAMARLAVAEALLNLSGAVITDIADIRCSANWMWPAKLPGEGARLYDAAIALRDILCDLGIAIDGGKDSLSMAARCQPDGGDKVVVKAPGELVIANYAPMPDVSKRVSVIPEPEDILIWIDLSPGKKRLGGTALAQALGQIGNDCPDVESNDMLKGAFQTIQTLVARDLLHAVHDISDGGLITTLLEMAFAGNVGMYISLNHKADSIPTLFSEEPGVVIALPESSLVQATKQLQENGIHHQVVGEALYDPVFQVSQSGFMLLCKRLPKLRAIWEESSNEIDKLQANPECVMQEAEILCEITPSYHLTFEPMAPKHETDLILPPKIAILRSQGSNGDREMAAAFMDAGFQAWDITMKDLLNGTISLSEFQGIAFVGGFSYADVMDSAKGWAGMIRFNDKLSQQFSCFYKRPDTFSLGVCNGCQLMALLGWVPTVGLKSEEQPRFIRNQSERFESRFSTVTITESPAIMLRGMAGSTLGVWVAHGEGRLHAKADQLKRLVDHGQTPIRYVDQEGKPTEVYPYNPNGSPGGITAFCSEDGHHLAMMPHPERTFQMRQWPWLPKDWRSMSSSPWSRMFQNAFEFCQSF